MSDVALVTATGARHLDEDMAPLLAALDAIGVAASAVVWDDGTVEWASFPLVVVRSAWDYVPRRGEFLAWADRVASITALVNSPAVLAWSTDKHYLADLAAAGVPVTPTAFLEPTDVGCADRIAAALEAGDIVVKPAVSAGSADTSRYRPGELVEAVAHAERLLVAGRSVAVQPYLDRVDQAGETAVVHFGGRYSHAARKGPILASTAEFVDGLFAAEDISAREATSAERAVAERALVVVPGGGHDLLYARVDLVPGPDGEPLVLEMELAEPSVFLAHAPGAAERFSRAIADALGR